MKKNKNVYFPFYLHLVQAASAGPTTCSVSNSIAAFTSELTLSLCFGVPVPRGTQCMWDVYTPQFWFLVFHRTDIHMLPHGYICLTLEQQGRLPNSSSSTERLSVWNHKGSRTEDKFNPTRCTLLHSQNIFYTACSHFTTSHDLSLETSNVLGSSAFYWHSKTD